jgi:hypothetical protein
LSLRLSALTQRASPLQRPDGWQPPPSWARSGRPCPRYWPLPGWCWQRRGGRTGDAKVRVERTLAAWPEVAQAVGLAGSRVQSAIVDVWGWRARFALARGQTIADVISRLPAIESGLGTFRGAVRVYPTPDDKANRFELRVLTSDPHADAIAWPGPSVTSITEPIDLGPFEDATLPRFCCCVGSRYSAEPPGRARAVVSTS